MESYNEDSDIRYYTKADLQYPENLHNLHNDLLFFLERTIIEKVEKLWQVWMIKKNMLYTLEI